MNTTESRGEDEKTTKSEPLPLHIKETGGKEYHCTICQKKFSRTQKYYHYGCSNGELKKHKCEQCGKCFATRSHLTYHLESHNTATYQCQDCNKSFGNRIVLQKHLKIHQRTDTYVCTFCNKEFKNKENLSAHTARHNNELNFECNFCSIKYATKSTLDQHKLSHFAKKHECTKCGKRFQRNSTLRLHLKRHTKTDLHSCTICLKKFNELAALQRHVKVHKIDNITKYRCIQCDIITVRKDNMQRHLRNMHTGVSFSDCIEILHPSEKEKVTTEACEDSSLVVNGELDERFLPKTVANSTVIKCIGNVEPVKVPNIVPQSRNSEPIETITTPLPLPIVKEVPVRTKKVKKKYDPIEMYRKIIGTEDNNDNDDGDEQIQSVAGERVDTVEFIEKPRNTPLNVSNFSATHWRKSLEKTYQHQEY